MGDKILLLWTVKNFEKFIPITKYPEISRWKFFQLLNYKLDKKKIVKKEKKKGKDGKLQNISIKLLSSANVCLAF